MYIYDAIMDSCSLVSGLYVLCANLAQYDMTILVINLVARLLSISLHLLISDLYAYLIYLTNHPTHTIHQWKLPQQLLGKRPWKDKVLPV
jgi:hypothetical protein